MQYPSRDYFNMKIDFISNRHGHISWLGKPPKKAYVLVALPLRPYPPPPFMYTKKVYMKGVGFTEAGLEILVKIF